MFKLNAAKKITHEVAPDYCGRAYHNVTQAHKGASRSRLESLDYFHWRCDQYSGYLDLMPVKGFDGKSILDFDCGPGT